MMREPESLGNRKHKKTGNIGEHQSFKTGGKHAGNHKA